MNSYLNKQIEYIFGKTFDEMTDEEKSEITEITIFLKDFNGDFTGASISDLLKFPSLKKCLINGFSITDNDLRLLDSIETLRGIQFSKCNFSESTIPLGDIELVVLDSCENVSKQLLQKNKSLRYLRVVNQDYFDAMSLNECTNLVEAYLQRTTVSNLTALTRLKELKLVNLNGSRFNFIAYTHLKSSVKVEYAKDSAPGLDR